MKFPESAESFFKDADRAYAKEEGIVGLSTGIRPLDGGLGGGLKSPDLLILAARPSMGKTALATNIAFNVARAGTPVIFFSLEMSAAQLAGRIICGEAYLPLQRVYRGELHAKEFEHLHKIGGSLLDTPLFIDETPSLNIVTLRNRARHLKRLYGIGLVVVDYLQLLETEARRGYISNRVQEISDISKSLKGLAKELDLPVLALSQLSRNVEQRDSKQPQLSDLRDSGSIEQDADVVMFVYREEYYLQNRKPEYGTVDFENWQIKADAASGKAEVIVAKNRNGSTGKVDLFFDKGIMRFREPINHENIT